MSRPEVGGPIWYEQHNPLGREDPSLVSATITSEALWRRAGVVNTRQERLKDSIKTHGDKIREAKEDLRTTYAREDILEADGKNIFRNAHRGRKDPNEVLEFKIRAIIRADKAAKRERREWRSTLPDEVQRALHKLEDGRRSLNNNRRSQKRYEIELRQIESISPKEVTVPEEVVDRNRGRATLVRAAAVFGLVGAIAAAAFFVKGPPQVSDFLKSMVDIKPGVTQAKGEETLPADIQALQARIDQLTESRDAYREENGELAQKLIEATLGAVPGYIPGQLRTIGRENRHLTEQNKILREQLDEARAAAPDYVEPIPSQVQAAFAPYGNGGDYALKKGDSLAKIAQNIGHALNLDLGHEPDREKIERLARRMALDNDIASKSLGTTGKDWDTALPIGRIVKLGNAKALAEDMTGG